MTYMVKDIFYTLQGEGAMSGRPAVFIRFAGCNLWSGREKDRAGAICKFCDTDFLGGTKYRNAGAIVRAALLLCPDTPHKMVVLTGGEPLLQVDSSLTNSLHHAGFFVAVETNGTRPLQGSVDWLCVSPKAGSNLVLDRADELKVVYPQMSLDLDSLSGFASSHKWLSPMAGPTYNENIKMAVAYCLEHPQWKLTVQAHKIWGVQ